MNGKRRKRISYDAEGEVHEYTFSTYRRQPFRVDDEFKRTFLQNLDRARKKRGFLVWAYVIMPEHVHVLIPAQMALTADILSSVKQPFAKRIVAKLKKENPELWKKMESGAKRGNSPYSFWQAGGGTIGTSKGRRSIGDASNISI